MIGAALVATLVGGIFISSNDDDDDNSDTDDQTGAPQPGPTSSGSMEGAGTNGSQETTDANSAHEGTDANDEITDYDRADDRDAMLTTLKGDDTVSFSDDEEVTWDIDTGPGDDQIEIGRTFSSIIHGGGGDDRITLDSGANAKIHGGVGNDTISVRDDAYYDLGSLALFGSEGDDVIEVNKLDGVTQLEDKSFDGPRMVGGDGSDRFDLSIELDEEMISLADFYGDNQVSEGPSDEPRSNVIGKISDFVSGEDQLTIDPASYAGAADYLGYDIVQSKDEQSTGITLHYAHKGQTDPVLHATLWLQGTPSIADGDLEFVNLPA